MEITRTTDAAEFLSVCGDTLQRNPVVSTVMATVAARAVGQLVPTDRPHWFCWALNGGEVVGTVMRTAPTAPYPLYALPMPDAAARAVAADLVARGEDVTAANGARPAVDLLMAELAAASDRSVRETMHLRLFELHHLIAPPPVRGALRAATEADLDLLVDWLWQFHVDSEEQGGRGVPDHLPRPTVEEVTSHLPTYTLWEVGGVPVSLVGAKSAYGVTRIGPVFTPAEHRGNGYAAALTAMLTARILESGERPCLFTDQANPTSNALYQRLGYEPVVDMVNLTLE